MNDDHTRETLLQQLRKTQRWVTFCHAIVGPSSGLLALVLGLGLYTSVQRGSVGEDSVIFIGLLGFLAVSIWFYVNVITTARRQASEMEKQLRDME